MRAFVIYLNGRKLCTAGVGDGVLTAVVRSVHRRLRSARDEDHVRTREDLALDVGGLVTTTEEHVLWKTPRLRSGDEVQIRIVDVESADEPNRRQRIDAIAREKSEEKYLEVVAKKRGWKILKPKPVKVR
jgi:hypothetical protein